MSKLVIKSGDSQISIETDEPLAETLNGILEQSVKVGELIDTITPGSDDGEDILPQVLELTLAIAELLAPENGRAATAKGLLEAQDHAAAIISLIEGEPEDEPEDEPEGA